MFDIYFEEGDPVAHDDEGWLALPGRTVLGDHNESFAGPIGWWSRPEYERQWFEAANRLLTGHRSTAFVLEPGRLWWMAWLFDDQVKVHQQLLVSEENGTAWTKSPKIVPYHMVPAYSPTSEDGETHSEWAVSLDDIKAFISRRVSYGRER